MNRALGDFSMVDPTDYGHPLLGTMAPAGAA